MPSRSKASEALGTEATLRDAANKLEPATNLVIQQADLVAGDWSAA